MYGHSGGEVSGPANVLKVPAHNSAFLSNHQDPEVSTSGKAGDLLAKHQDPKVSGPANVLKVPAHNSAFLSQHRDPEVDSHGPGHLRDTSFGGGGSPSSTAPPKQ